VLTFTLTRPTIHGGMRTFDFSILTVDDIENDDPQDSHSLTQYWRTEQKHYLNDLIYAVFRPLICLGCDQPIRSAWDMHEGILSRQDFRGKRRKYFDLIYCLPNLIPLCPSCNRSDGGVPPSRDAAWEHQKEFYGREIMRTWYYDIACSVLKLGPPRYFD